MEKLFTTYNFPKHLLKRASLRGKEYAWSLDDIPHVIAAAKAVDLVSLGGQLQFRLADGSTCECYEVEVNTSELLKNLPRTAWINLSAAEATRQFLALTSKFNFINQGKAAFGKHFDEIGATDADLLKAMCFVWYVSIPIDEDK